MLLIPKRKEPKETFQVPLLCGRKRGCKRRVFVCGSTNNGRLGIEVGSGNEGSIQSIPKELKDFEQTEIISVHPSKYHTFFITTDHKLYVCGRGKGSGIEGLTRHDVIDKPTIIPLLKHYKIHDFACYREHCILLTWSGEVFTFGCRKYGQLGRGIKCDHNPAKIEFFDNMGVKLVCAGQEHCFVATDDDRLFGFGSTKYLGLGTSRPLKQYTPVEIVAMRGISIKKMDSSTHTLALTKDGNVYIWGDGVGLLSPVLTPQLLDIPHKVVDIAVGANHNLICTVEGLVFGMGNTKYGEAAIDSRNFIDKPTKIETLENYNIVAVSAGNRHSVFLTDKGKVFVSGSNRYGQLGTHIYLHTKQPKPVGAFLNVPIEQIACGAYHTVFLEKGENIMMTIDHMYKCERFHDIIFKFEE